MPDIQQHVDPNNVRKHRKLAGFSLEMLAKAASLWPSRLSTIERGLSLRVSEEVKRRISVALGVSVAELFPDV